MTICHTPQRTKPKWTSWLPLLLWLGMGGPAVAAEVRVAIHQGVSQLTVGSSTPAVLLDGAGRSVGKVAAFNGVSAQSVSGGVMIAGQKSWQLMLVPQEGGLVYIGDRWYHGKLRLVRTSNGLAAVNQVDMENYLASVIGKEMYPTWPLEALKTQAVASRSYALYKIQRPQSKLYDVVDTTASQVYSGISTETPSTQEAAQATAGQILTYQGKVIEAVFHAASGGHTENSEQVWISPVPYLRAVPDFDQDAPVYQWTLNLTATQMRQRIPGIGNILRMTPVQSTPHGRVRLMKVQGDAGSVVLKGSTLRQALGLRSTLFSVSPEMGTFAGAISTRPVGFQINGRGSGHGLGMSQWGAYGMAQQGKTYQEILQHYYPGTQLSMTGQK